MAIDPSKLTVEQNKLFNELKVGGLNANELEQLKKAGVNDELLAAMKAEFPDTGEVPNGDPEMPKEKGWLERKMDELYPNAKTSWAEASPLHKLAKLAGGVAALGLLPLAALTGCAPDIVVHHYEGNNTFVTDNIGIGITVNADSSNQEIVDAIKQLQREVASLKLSNEAGWNAIGAKLSELGIGSDKMLEVLHDLLNEVKDGNEKADNINAVLKVIVAQLAEQGKDINAILKQLEGMGVDLKDIVAALKENGKTLGDIYDALLKQGENQKDIVALLMAIGSDVNEIKDMLKELGKKDKDILELLKGVYDNTGKLLETNQDILAKLNEIAGKIANGQGGAVDFNDLKPIIEEAVNKLIATYNDGNEKVLAKLQEILEKIPAGCKCDSSQILAKLEIIIKELQNPEGNHEGVLDDLDDIFG